MKAPRKSYGMIKSHGSPIRLPRNVPPRKSHGITTEAPTGLASAIGRPRKPDRSPSNVPREHYGSTMGTLKSHVYTPEVPLEHVSPTEVPFPWKSYDNPVGITRKYRGNSGVTRKTYVGLPWDFDGTSMGPPWGVHGFQ